MFGIDLFGFLSGGKKSSAAGAKGDKGQRADGLKYELKALMLPGSRFYEDFFVVGDKTFYYKDVVAVEMNGVATEYSNATITMVVDRMLVRTGFDVRHITDGLGCYEMLKKVAAENQAAYEAAQAEQNTAGMAKDDASEQKTVDLEKEERIDEEARHE